MLVMQRLSNFVRRGHQITLVSPDPCHYYSGMGPGLLGGSYRPKDTYVHVARMVQERGGAFAQDLAVRIDTVNRRLQLASGAELDYDVLSCNVGSEVPGGSEASDGAFLFGPKLVPVKPIVNLARVRENLLALTSKEPMRLAVVGGGAAGCEVAGNLRRLLNEIPRQGQIDLFTGGKLLNRFSPKVERAVRQNFSKRSISVRTEKVIGGADGVLRLSDQSEQHYDLTVLSTGVQPPALFAASGLTLGADGGMAVNRYLQSLDAPEIFGGGDCICFAHNPLPKVGVHAVRQNPILLHNLMAALEGQPLKAYRPQKQCLLALNLGDGSGVLQWRRWVVSGRLAFRFKDWLDRSFMRRFQVSGVLEASRR